MKVVFVVFVVLVAGVSPIPVGPPHLSPGFMDEGMDHNNDNQQQPVEPSGKNVPAAEPPVGNQPQPQNLEKSEVASGEVKTAESRTPSIVVAIPSMRRWKSDHTPAPEQYLKPLLDSLWNQASPEEQGKVSFLLMNVDREPSAHKELLSFQNHPAVTIIEKVQEKSDTAPSSNGKFEISGGAKEVSLEAFEWVTGETADVPKLLLKASTMAPNVLFLEDDVLATSHAIGKVLQHVEELKNEGKSYFMVDLYTPALPWRPDLGAANKQRYDYECCTQAMLFNSSRIAELADYEFQHNKSPVDDNIRDWVRQDPENRPVFAMVPNPFEHIGRYSSNAEKSTETVEHTSLNFVP